MCDDHGNKFSYRCPEETAFRQDALICDHAHLVKCQAITHLSSRFLNKNVDREKIHTTPSIKTTIASLDNHKLSISRSFQVIQRPDKSVSNKLQSGFIFSARLFLKDQNQTQNQTDQITFIKYNVNSKNRPTLSSTQTPIEVNWNLHNNKLNLPKSLSLSSSEVHTFARDKNTTYPSRAFESVASSLPTRVLAYSTQHPPCSPREKSILSYDSDYNSYSETLKSIQANARTTTIQPTTELPVYALTFSLKPLVPNKLEYDPYYPKQPTSTEAYYTPSNRNELDNNTYLFSSSQVLSITTHSNLLLEFPSILPDLNMLEDLVDRRKFFYIPRANLKAI